MATAGPCVGDAANNSSSVPDPGTKPAQATPAPTATAAPPVSSAASESSTARPTPDGSTALPPTQTTELRNVNGGTAAASPRPGIKEEEDGQPTAAHRRQGRADAAANPPPLPLPLHTAAVGGAVDVAHGVRRSLSVDAPDAVWDFAATTSPDVSEEVLPPITTSEVQQQLQKASNTAPAADSHVLRLATSSATPSRRRADCRAICRRRGDQQPRRGDQQPRCARPKRHVGASYTWGRNAV
ncbi:mucin-7-like [Schistocerca gregaria]|uniref:mucin-7-like n=1 Tax=Schistocerca gregaria TaxID=7010 RepID=UPI00211E5544|nr:mucin-7-like [Schistocerca gregaria]